tara:strand:+ start:138 stop:542 length:405 start_codon:yes stop_codon:yes gene_type:complete
MSNLIRWVEFTSLGDHRGSLVAIEENKIVPFNIKRVYYMFNTIKGVVRGKHAHLQLKQIMLCVTGNCRITLDNGFSRESVILDSPTKGLLLEGLIWREMSDFSDDCLLLVLASDFYDEDDYIRDYDEFKRLVKP